MSMQLTFAQVGAIPTTPLELIRHATVVTQVVLLILIILSVASWAIMISKWFEFRRVNRAGRALWLEIERISRFEQLQSLLRRARASPFTRVLIRGLEFIAQLKTSAAPRDPSDKRLSGSQVEALQLILATEATVERDRLSRFVPPLAVIGSVSPLLGLLGTVVGVINAFIGIATQGSGNLAAVAPGVAEALVATAAGLSVAIPAFFGYNIFASRLNRMENELEGMGTEMIAILVRDGHI